MSLSPGAVSYVPESVSWYSSCGSSLYPAGVVLFNQFENWWSPAYQAMEYERSVPSFVEHVQIPITRPSRSVDRWPSHPADAFFVSHLYQEWELSLGNHSSIPAQTAFTSASYASKSTNPAAVTSTNRFCSSATSDTPS